MGYGKVNFDKFDKDDDPLQNNDESVIKKYKDYLIDFTPGNTDEMYTDAGAQRIVPKNL